MAERVLTLSNLWQRQLIDWEKARKARNLTRALLAGTATLASGSVLAAGITEGAALQPQEIYAAEPVRSPMPPAQEVTIITDTVAGAIGGTIYEAGDFPWGPKAHSVNGGPYVKFGK